ncbi:hypothetical protein [Sphingomonas sp. MMS24-J13]|uniref:hypothetical protein n=1 Tax=Sphingomonas sp. MMS24-J13 TaxID=3238686 RepID=UPI00384DE728
MLKAALSDSIARFRKLEEREKDVRERRFLRLLRKLDQHYASSIERETKAAK